VQLAAAMTEKRGVTTPVLPIFITVDPKRDTVAQVRAYVKGARSRRRSRTDGGIVLTKRALTLSLPTPRAQSFRPSWSA